MLGYQGGWGWCSAHPVGWRLFVHQNSPHCQAGKGWRELERGLVRSTVHFSSSANPHAGVTIPGRWDALFLASCKFLGNEQSNLEAVQGAGGMMRRGLNRRWWRLSGPGAPGAAQETD